MTDLMSDEELRSLRHHICKEPAIFGTCLICRALKEIYLLREELKTYEEVDACASCIVKNG